MGNGIATSFGGTLDYGMGVSATIGTQYVYTRAGGLALPTYDWTGPVPSLPPPAPAAGAAPAPPETPHTINYSYRSAAAGALIIRFAGDCRIPANVIWLRNFTIDVVDGESFATFAAACGDPLARGTTRTVTRMWADGRTVYDPDIGIELVDFEQYDGNQTTPDPEIEADLGVGDTPVYKNIAYVRFTDLPLKPFNNQIPAITVEYTDIPGTGLIWDGIRPIWQEIGDQVLTETNSTAERSSASYINARSLDVVQDIGGKIVVKMHVESMASNIYWGLAVEGGSNTTQPGFSEPGYVAGSNGNVYDGVNRGILAPLFSSGDYLLMGLDMDSEDDFISIFWGKTNIDGTAVVFGSDWTNILNRNFAAPQTPNLIVIAGMFTNGDKVSFKPVLPSELPSGFSGYSPTTGVMSYELGMTLMGEATETYETDDFVFVGEDDFTPLGLIIAQDVNFQTFMGNWNYYFGRDYFERGHKIVNSKRVEGSTFTVDDTLTDADLMAPGNQGTYQFSRADGEEIPWALETSYIDSTQQFQFIPIRARRAGYPVEVLPSHKRDSITVPVVATAADALDHTAQELFRRGASRDTFRLKLLPTKRRIEPCDIHRITTGGQTYTLYVRNVRIGDDSVDVEYTILLENDTPSTALEGFAGTGTGVIHLSDGSQLGLFPMMTMNMGGSSGEWP